MFLLQKCTFQRALAGHGETIQSISYHKMILLIEIENIVKFGVVSLALGGATELESLELPAFSPAFQNAGWREKCRPAFWNAGYKN
jgi:hypothetical protein